MLPDKLIAMANQIGQFFATQPGTETERVAGVAGHLRRFWEPRMREMIVSLPEAELARLDPLPRAAVAVLAQGAKPRIAETMPEGLPQGF